jgi:hypothetical protein
MEMVEVDGLSGGELLDHVEALAATPTGARSRSCGPRSDTPTCTTATRWTRRSRAGRGGAGPAAWWGRDAGRHRVRGRGVVGPVGGLDGLGGDVDGRWAGPVPPTPAAVAAGRGRSGPGLLRTAGRAQDPGPEPRAGGLRRLPGRRVRRRPADLDPLRAPRGRRGGRCRRRGRCAARAQAAEHQFARPTRAEEGDGAIRGFYIRAPFGTVAVLDVTLDRIARILARLGDNDSADQRRVKALLILCRPDVAAGLYQMVATGSTEATTHPPAEAASPVDWSALLPTVVVYLHCYRGPHADRDDTPARRGGRPGRGCRTTHADLGP